MWLLECDGEDVDYGRFLRVKLTIHVCLRRQCRLPYCIDQINFKTQTNKIYFFIRFFLILSRKRDFFCLILIQMNSFFFKCTISFYFKLNYQNLKIFKVFLCYSLQNFLFINICVLAHKFMHSFFFLF